MTPPTIALTNRGPRALSLSRSKGTTFLLGVLLHATRSAMTTTSTTPSKRLDGSATSDHFGPLVFRAAIRVDPYPRHFRPMMHISKYDSETNLDHWLEDYHLAMKARGTNDDFIV